MGEKPFEGFAPTAAANRENHRQQRVTAISDTDAEKMSYRASEGPALADNLRAPVIEESLDGSDHWAKLESGQYLPA